MPASQTRDGAACARVQVLNGDEYTLDADTWSYGVIVWELVTRREPWVRSIFGACRCPCTSAAKQQARVTN